jgi:hypothetical protein
MTGRRVLVALAAAVVALAGCARGTPAAAPVAAPSFEGVQLTLVRTGGFAGVRDAIAIDAGGGWRVTDKAGRGRAGRLRAEQQDALRRLAADPGLAAEATRSPQPYHCSDAYGYALTVRAVRVSFVDCPGYSHPPTAAVAIVRLVTQAVGG